MASSNASYVQSLTALGLTGLEARIYGFLVTSPAATGYRVACEIDRPTANTYKALDSLLARGVVIAGDDEPRRYRSVSPQELLRVLERRFDGDRDRAAAALSSLDEPEDDDGVYRLRTAPQAIARFEEMLARARGTALALLPSSVALRIRPALAAAAARGVAVVIATDTSLDLPGVEQIADPAITTGTAQLAVDCREMQIAAFAGETLRHAIYTASRPLSEAHHRLLAAEHLFVRVGRARTEGLDMDDMEAAHERCCDHRRDMGE